MQRQMERKRMVLMNRYEVGRLLGMGNFAKVYQGRDTWLGGSVAIKVIDKEKVIKTDWILAEISAMMGLRHPNIVQLYDVVDSETKKYLIMEYLRGGDLYDMVAKGALDEDVVRKYFQQLISAVDYCHSVGVYHRDLKPEKLLLDESGNLKITDFGLCALSNSRRQDGLLHTACGTLTYISPEVINRKGYDGAKADIWSCGVVLFILLAGHLPFYDPSTIWLCKKICSGEYKFPLWFSPEVRKLLAKILVPDPEKRVIIDYIMEDSWFKKGCNPTCMDAFDMTLLSKALNLSGLLEENDDMISLYKILNISGLLEENDGQNAESELLELKELQEPFNLQCYQGAGPILTH